MSTPALELNRFSITLHIGESTQHDYLSIHPELLKAKGVTHSDWEAESHQIGSGFMIVDYRNGLQFFGAMGSLTVNESQGLGLGGEHKAIRIVQTYMEELAPEVFQRATLSWSVRFPVDDSSRWLSDRFLSPEFNVGEGGSIFVFPTIIYDLGGFSLLFRFTLQEDDGFVGIECEIESPLRSGGELAEWLVKYRAYESAMLSRLNLLLEA